MPFRALKGVDPGTGRIEEGRPVMILASAADAQDFRGRMQARAYLWPAYSARHKFRLMRFQRLGAFACLTAVTNIFRFLKNRAMLR